MEPILETEFILRLTAAVIFGLIVGAERSRVGKRAGMRTYALVALGAALFVIIGQSVAQQTIGFFDFDPLRIASQIVVGIGFLGAGIIFVEKKVLTGLTTAAGLWVVAAIGAAAGYGMYLVSAYVTILSLFIFEALWYIESRFVRKAESLGHPEHHEEGSL